jgi:hypothetical protein
MSGDLIGILAGAIVLTHGIAHGGAIGALWWIDSGRARDPGGWRAARSWIAPSLDSQLAGRLATGFWLAAMFGFALTALSLWGVLLPENAWRGLGIASAAVSATGIVVFLGDWPMPNTAAALLVDAAVVIAAVSGWEPG